MSNERSTIRILFVEDSKFYAQIIQDKLASMDHVSVDYASDTAEARDFLQSGKKYDLALVDLNLPDSTTGAFAKEVCKLKISTIVFSGVLDNSLRKELFSLGIIDYITKDSPVAIEHLKDLIGFLVQQRGESVLVVNTDDRLRSEQVRMLENLNMSAWSCTGYQEALRLVNSGKIFSLALIGHDLDPNTGVELISALRHRFSSSQLAVIAIPDHDMDLAAQYLRFGANDFLQYPYSPEEFQYRIRNAVKVQHQLLALETAATRDYLTKLLNRRAFFEVSIPLFASSKRKELPLSVAMVDIDHFKKVNDTYGHDIGDQAICAVASALNSCVRTTDILARFGGEEFCLLMPEVKEEDLPDLMTRYQKAIQNIQIPSIEDKLNITVSIGIAKNIEDTLEATINIADQALYEAKNSGRDKFIIQ